LYKEDGVKGCVIFSNFFTLGNAPQFDEYFSFLISAKLCKQFENMERKPLIQKYFCAICKLAEEPNKDLKLLQKCNCGLVFLCKDKCAKQTWPEHQELCQKRQMDIKKWNDFIPISRGKDFKEFAQHRLKVAFDTLEFAEEKQDFFAFQKALQVFEKAVFIIRQKYEDNTVFDIEIYDDARFGLTTDYPVLKITSTYLYLLLTLGKADVIKQKFIDATEDTPHAKLGWSGFPSKKRHFLARIAEMLVIIMEAKVPEYYDIPERKFVEKNGEVYGKLKKIFHRMYIEKPIMYGICTGKTPPLCTKEDLSKAKFGDIAIGQLLRKYFERYPDKTAYLQQMWNRSEEEEKNGTYEKNNNENKDADEELGTTSDEDDIAFVDFMCSMGMGMK